MTDYSENNKRHVSTLCGENIVSIILQYVVLMLIIVFLGTPTQIKCLLSVGMKWVQAYFNDASSVAAIFFRIIYAAENMNIL